MKPKYANFTDEEIVKMVEESTSFLQLQVKMGYSNKGGSATKRIRNMLDEKNIDYSHFLGHAWNKKGITAVSTLKKQLIEKRGYKCEKCGLSTWMDEPITLELHHKNGDKGDISEDNLMLLCPNCHAQTDNWRGRKGKNHIDDETFLEALKNTPNINQACLSLGIPANQNNYNRAKILLKSVT